jgi:hypothetical protein
MHHGDPTIKHGDPIIKLINKTKLRPWKNKKPKMNLELEAK